MIPILLILFETELASRRASVPEGQNENSPALQRWVRSREGQVPKGRLNELLLPAIPAL